MTFKQPQETHRDAHTSHKNTSLQEERKKERKHSNEKNNLEIWDHLLRLQTISSPEAEDMVVTKCWAARKDAHTRPHTQTHTRTNKTLKQRGRLEWLGGWRKARLHPSSHSSQNRLLIFRRNGSASELVNGDATITLEIRQFFSLNDEWKTKKTKSYGKVDPMSHSSQNCLSHFPPEWIGPWNATLTLDVRQFWSLMVNGKLNHVKKNIDPLSHSSQNHLFIFFWNKFAFGILLHSSRIGQWNTKITVWHLTVLVSDGEWKNWIMSETLTTCHILARIIFSFSAGMNLPQNVLQIIPNWSTEC
jgi:hypothetical protein